MLITKLNLYKSEWLDLVFSNRNTSYGAYELRRTYSTNMLKSMGITFTMVAAGIFFYSVFNNNGNQPTVRDIPPAVTDSIVVELKDMRKKEEPVIEAAPESKPAKPQKSIEQPKLKQDVIPTHVTTDESKAIDPVKTKDLTGVIASTQSEGDDKGDNLPPTTPAGVPGGEGGGDGNGEGTDDGGVHTTIGLSEMPMPDGGMEGWNKFLNRNMRFPALALEQGVNGRVFISFIIEKDGSLTDIKVERKAGYGFDEEAIRVLKKAKPWKPGMQNGKPVRVRYTIPISFTITQ
jgi:periplasmic protein TonB